MKVEFTRKLTRAAAITSHASQFQNLSSQKLPVKTKDGVEQ